MSSISIQNSDLKSLILSSPEPLLIKNQLFNWTPLHWSLSAWFGLLESSGNKSAMFRCGENTCLKEPHWESKCGYKNHPIGQFINHAKEMSQTNQWMYFDYKHVAECMVDEVIEQVQSPWKLVGFPERTLKDTTLWIGSKGAHTPCHYDTYGCNLVAQIIGRKQWILFPPSDPGIVATQTRVPYEESSVYSKVNFVCGKHIQESSLSSSTPYIITLEPGDILLVPHRWWHYVEHLSTGLSLNTWIPLNDKKESIAYLDEWLVRYFVKNIIQNLSEEEQTILLNPNEKEYLISENQQPTCFDEIKHLIQRYQEVSSTASDLNQRLLDCKTIITTETCTKSTSREPTKTAIVVVNKIQPFTKDQFYEFCKNKCACLKKLSTKSPLSSNIDETSLKFSTNSNESELKMLSNLGGVSSIISNTAISETNMSISETKTNMDINETKTNMGINETKTNMGINETKTNMSINETKTNMGINETNTNMDINKTKTNMDINETKTNMGINETKTNMDINETKTNMSINETKSKTKISLHESSSNPNTNRPSITNTIDQSNTIITNIDPSQKSSSECVSENNVRNHKKCKFVPEQINSDRKLKSVPEQINSDRKLKFVPEQINSDRKLKSVPEQTNNETIQKSNQRSQKRVRNQSPSDLSLNESKSAKISGNSESEKLIPEFGTIESSSRIVGIVSEHHQIELTENKSSISKHSQKEFIKDIVSQADSQCKSIVSKADSQFESIVSEASRKEAYEAESIGSEPSQTSTIVGNHSALFQAFTHPDVIQLVREKLLKQLEVE